MNTDRYDYTETDLDHQQEGALAAALSNIYQDMQGKGYEAADVTEFLQAYLPKNESWIAAAARR